MKKVLILVLSIISLLTINTKILSSDQTNQANTSSYKSKEPVVSLKFNDDVEFSVTGNKAKKISESSQTIKNLTGQLDQRSETIPVMFDSTYISLLEESIKLLSLNIQSYYELLEAIDYFQNYLENLKNDNLAKIIDLTNFLDMYLFYRNHKIHLLSIIAPIAIPKFKEISDQVVLDLEELKSFLNPNFIYLNSSLKNLNPIKFNIDSNTLFAIKNNPRVQSYIVKVDLNSNSTNILANAIKFRSIILDLPNTLFAIESNQGSDSLIKIDLQSNQKYTLATSLMYKELIFDKDNNALFALEQNQALDIIKIDLTTNQKTILAQGSSHSTSLVSFSNLMLDKNNNFIICKQSNNNLNNESIIKIDLNPIQDDNLKITTLNSASKFHNLILDKNNNILFAIKSNRGKEFIIEIDLDRSNIENNTIVLDETNSKFSDLILDKENNTLFAIKETLSNSSIIKINLDTKDILELTNIAQIKDNYRTQSNRFINLALDKNNNLLTVSLEKSPREIGTLSFKIDLKTNNLTQISHSAINRIHMQSLLSNKKFLNTSNGLESLIKYPGFKLVTKPKTNL